LITEQKEKSPLLEKKKLPASLRVRKALSRFRSLAFSNPLTGFGTVAVIVFVGIATLYILTGGAIALYSATAQNLSLTNAPPSLSHIFGTDFAGRDLFSRVLAALPVDIGIPVLIVFLSVIIGIVFGMIAGYFGGVLEEAIMRICDLFLAFPTIIMALAVAATLGPSLINAAIALTFVWWPPYVRLVRGGVLAVKSEDYIAASKTLNSSFLYIMRKGLFPNILPAVLVYASLDIGTALISVSSLGFLGVGIPPDLPELGAMVASIMTVVYSYPWEALLPSIVVLLIVLSFSLFGDGIREITDVKVRPHMVMKNRFLGAGRVDLKNESGQISQ
jgi:peptide/nickel transport system permease protein